MKYPKKRRPLRVHRWEGVVERIASRYFTARLVSLDRDLDQEYPPEYLADFDRKHLRDAVRGSLFYLTVKRHGNGRVSATLVPRTAPPWTQEDFDRAWQWAGRESEFWQAEGALLTRFWGGDPNDFE